MCDVWGVSGCASSLLCLTRGIHAHGHTQTAFRSPASLARLLQCTRLLEVFVTSFVFVESCQGGTACDKLEGADPPVLAKLVQELATERVTEKTATAGVEGVQPDLEAKLKKLIR